MDGETRKAIKNEIAILKKKNIPIDTLSRSRD